MIQPRNTPHPARPPQSSRRVRACSDTHRPRFRTHFFSKDLKSCSSPSKRMPLNSLRRPPDPKQPPPAPRKPNASTNSPRAPLDPCQLHTTRLRPGPEKPGPGDSRTAHRFSRIWRISTDFAGSSSRGGSAEAALIQERMSSTRKKAISENRSNPWSSAFHSNLWESHSIGNREMCVNDSPRLSCLDSRLSPTIHHLSPSVDTPRARANNRPVPPPSSSGPGCRILSPETGVQIPLGVSKTDAPPSGASVFSLLNPQTASGRRQPADASDRPWS